MKLPRNSALIFVTGAVILGVELAASRYMAPMFGSSLYIWGAILAITLLCLSAGYSWGGRLGEKLEKPTDRLILFALISSGWLGVLPFIQRPVALLGLAVGPSFGPLLVTTLLFAFPILLLATATPLVFAENNREQQGDHAATVMGDLFAVSTVGSVAGAIITAYGLIPLLGLKTTFLFLSVTLIVISAPRIYRGLHIRAASNIVFIIALTQIAYDPDRSSGVTGNFSILHQESSRYGELSVLEDINNQDRVLLLNGTSQNMVGGPNYDISRFEYTDVIAGHLGQYPSSNKNALVLGLGAGVFSKNLTSKGYRVESVDIDPAVYRIAREFFNFDDNLTVHIQDARSFLTDARDKKAEYGLIILDVAGGGTQPAHIFNLEAFQTMRDILSEDGLLVLNQLAIVAPDENDLVLHTLATLSAIYPNVRALNVYPDQPLEEVTNLVTFASNHAPGDPAYRTQISEQPLNADISGIRPITDNWNPSDVWSVEINKRWHLTIGDWLGYGALIPI